MTFCCDIVSLSHYKTIVNHTELATFKLSYIHTRRSVDYVADLGVRPLRQVMLFILVFHWCHRLASNARITSVKSSCTNNNVSNALSLC